MSRPLRWSAHGPGLQAAVLQVAHGPERPSPSRAGGPRRGPAAQDQDQKGIGR